MNSFSCYIPPKLIKAESMEFLETLSDAVAEAKTTSEGWFVIGRDWNYRQLKNLLDMYPDIKKIMTLPTRKSNVLDIILSNINQYTRNVQECAPLEGELGQTSDHKMVIVEALLPRPRTFSWETHEYLEITKDGTDHFQQRLETET